MNLQNILIIVGIVEAFSLIGASPRKGLEYMFIVPFIYSIAILKWGRIFHMKKGLGLNIFIFISILRYLIQPVLIFLSDGELGKRLPEAHPNSYNVAIIIYIIECVISFYTICKFYPREIAYFRQHARIENNKQYKINSQGWIFVFILIMILFSRVNSWLPELNILWLKEGSDKGLVLDATFFNVLKVFFFIFFLCKSIQTKKKVYLFLAVILGILSFISYFGRNRSFIFETSLTTIYIFIYSFPKYKKTIIALLTPFAIIIIGLMFISKQYGVEDISEYSINYDTEGLTKYSNDLEEYINGFWTVARSYQASITTTLELSVAALIKDIMDGMAVLRDIPFLKTEIFPMTDSLLSSSDIFKLSLMTPLEYAQMLSFSGGIFIIGGSILGWPLMIIGNFLMIRLLVRLDARSIQAKNPYYQYIYIWMSCLMGLIHCYCLQTILFCWIKFIFFFWLILVFNNSENKLYGLQSKF